MTFDKSEELTFDKSEEFPVLTLPGTKPARFSQPWRLPPALREIVFLNRIHLYRKSPDSGKRPNKSRT